MNAEDPKSYPANWFPQLQNARVPQTRADLLKELAELPDAQLAKILADAKAAYGPVVDGLTD
jgi:hypothetical protein